MNGRILLLLVSTATVAACARPTPPEVTSLDTVEATTTASSFSVDAATETSVAAPTTKPPAPPPPPRRTTTTTTNPPPPKPPDRWALGAADRRSASSVIGATLDSIDPFSLWASFCPKQTLCVKINYQLLPGLDTAENGCITKVDIPDPLHENGTVTYVFRRCDVEPEPTT